MPAELFEGGQPDTTQQQPAASPSLGDSINQQLQSEPSPSQPQTPSSQPSSEPARGLPPGQSQATPQPVQDEWSLRSAAAQMFGVRPDQFGGDREAFEYMIRAIDQRMQQYAERAQYGDYYLANRQKFEQPAQAAPAQPAAPAKQEWWNPPEWQDEWEQYLTTDAQGRVVPKQYADPSLALKYEAHRKWQAEKLKSFLQNPIEAIKPGLEEVIQKAIDDKLKAGIGQYDNTQFAARAEQEVAPWFYQSDPQGQPIVNAYGQRVLTPAGQTMYQHIHALRQSGINDPQRLYQLALMLTERDAMGAYLQQHQQQGQQQQQQAPEQVNAQLKQETVRRPGGTRLANRSGAAEGTGANVAVKGQTLGQMMMAEAKRRGVADANVI